MTDYRAKIRSKKVPEHVHGSQSGYTNYGCRCQACTDAQMAARRRYTAMSLSHEA